MTALDDRLDALHEVPVVKNKGIGGRYALYDPECSAELCTPYSLPADRKALLRVHYTISIAFRMMEFAKCLREIVLNFNYKIRTIFSTKLFLIGYIQ